jgi:hypothetical protein
LAVSKAGLNVNKYVQRAEAQLWIHLARLHRAPQIMPIQLVKVLKLKSLVSRMVQGQDLLLLVVLRDVECGC